MIDSLIHASTILMDIAPSIISVSLITNHLASTLMFPLILFILKISMYSFVIYGLVMQGLDGTMIREQSIKLLFATNCINMLMTIAVFIIIILYPRKDENKKNK